MASLRAQAIFSESLPVQGFIQQTLCGINQALQKQGPALIVAHGAFTLRVQLDAS